MKDHCRDYATAAFRFYAKVGGQKRYIRDLLGDIQKQKGFGTINPTEGAMITQERVLEEKAAELADLDAVERTIHIIEQLEESRHTLQVLEFVYFKDAHRELKKGEIENRVHYAELHIPASRRQIFYWLGKARKIFTNERGLRA